MVALVAWFAFLLEHYSCNLKTSVGLKATGFSPQKTLSIESSKPSSTTPERCNYSPAAFHKFNVCCRHLGKITRSLSLTM